MEVFLIVVFAPRAPIYQYEGVRAFSFAVSGDEEDSHCSKIGVDSVSSGHSVLVDQPVNSPSKDDTRGDNEQLRVLQEGSHEGEPAS